jgi:hypothetical protein
MRESLIYIANTNSYSSSSERMQEEAAEIIAVKVSHVKSSSISNERKNFLLFSVKRSIY